MILLSESCAYVLLLLSEQNWNEIVIVKGLEVSSDCEDITKTDEKIEFKPKKVYLRIDIERKKIQVNQIFLELCFFAARKRQWGNSSSSIKLI